MNFLNDYFVKERPLTGIRWCRRCGRKHSSQKQCDLEKLKDLTVRRYDEHKALVFEGTPVGRYRVKVSK